MINRLYEHLKTQKKYNTLEIKYLEALRLLEERTAERNAAERDYIKCKAKFDKRVKLLVDENVDLKKKIATQKEKIKELKEGVTNGKK